MTFAGPEWFINPALGALRATWLGYAPLVAGHDFHLPALGKHGKGRTELCSTWVQYFHLLLWAICAANVQLHRNPSFGHCHSARTEWFQI